MFFKVSGPDDRDWMLYPNDDSVTLHRLGEIRYGEVPSNCHQAEPTIGLAPAFIEGVKYVAFAVIFDYEPLRSYFTVKEGRAVPTPDGRSP